MDAIRKRILVGIIRGRFMA